MVVRAHGTSYKALKVTREFVFYHERMFLATQMLLTKCQFVKITRRALSTLQQGILLPYPMVLHHPLHSPVHCSEKLSVGCHFGSCISVVNQVDF